MARRGRPPRVARPRILDLFCGEGGASEGYHRAGFDVFGVDLNDDHSDRKKRPRPKPLERYPFRSWEGNAIDFMRSGQWEMFGPFAAIHASPPCQAFSPITRINRGSDREVEHPDLIEPVRLALDETGLPYVIENVPEAPLRDPVLLCGSMFDPPLDVRRHRAFETNWPLLPPALGCRHDVWPPRFRSVDYRGRKSGRLMGVVPVYGGTRFKGDHELRRRAMEIDWMTTHGLKESIPPRYTEYIGRRLLEHVQPITGLARAQVEDLDESAA